MTDQEKAELVHAAREHGYELSIEMHRALFESGMEPKQIQFMIMAFTFAGIHILSQRIMNDVCGKDALQRYNHHEAIPKIQFYKEEIEKCVLDLATAHLKGGCTNYQF